MSANVYLRTYTSFCPAAILSRVAALWRPAPTLPTFLEICLHAVYNKLWARAVLVACVPLLCGRWSLVGFWRPLLFICRKCPNTLYYAFYMGVCPWFAP